MEYYAQYAKDKLLETIQSLEALKSLYVHHAAKDFTRIGKLWTEKKRFASAL